MAQLTVYDSEGFEYDRGGRGGQQNEQIRQYFFAGVMIAVDLTRSPKVTGFFRARETDIGRSEQFYARYRADTTTGLLSNFKSSVERWADRNDMTLVTDTEDASFFRNLTGSPGDPPGSAFEHHTLGAVLDRGESVRVGVGSDEDALALLQEYVTEHNVSRIAITSDSEGGNLDDFDMVIDRGGYRGVEFLGDTETKVQQVRPEVEDRIVSATIDDVRSQIRELKQKTSIGDAELERRFRDRLSIFSSPGGRESRRSTGAVSSSQRARSQTSNDAVSIGPISLSQRSMKAISVVFVIALVLLASGVVAAQLNVLPPWVPFSGDSAPDESAGEDPIDPSLAVTGPMNDTEHSGMIQVTGKTNVTDVKIYLNLSGETLATATPEIHSNDTFQATLDPGNENGSATIKVRVKNEEGDPETEIRTIMIISESDSANDTPSAKPSLEVESPQKNDMINENVSIKGTTNASRITVEFRRNGSNIESKDENVTSGEFYVGIPIDNATKPGTIVVRAISETGQTAERRIEISNGNVTSIKGSETNSTSNETTQPEPSLDIKSPTANATINGSFDVTGETNASKVTVKVVQNGSELDSSNVSPSNGTFKTRVDVQNVSGKATVVVTASSGSAETQTNVTINLGDGKSSNDVSGGGASPSDLVRSRTDMSAPVGALCRIPLVQRPGR